MLLHRIAKTRYAQDLSGTGARLFGGRWNPKGQAVLYTSENRALAALEFLVHLEATAPPEDFNLLTLTVPDGLEMSTYSAADLPLGWNDYPYQVSVQVGKKWLKEVKTLLLQVPSTIIQQEYNILLNPLHPAFLEVRLLSIEPFGFDSRLLQ
jgi:RES domain-containing protein